MPLVNVAFKLQGATFSSEKRFAVMTTTTESMAMSSNKTARPARNLKAAPPHPLYDDEISPEQLETIRRLADPEGVRAAKRVILYPSLV